MPPVVWMSTTAGATSLTASITALDSEMRTSLTGWVSPGVSAATSSPVPGSRSARLVTATADRAPDTMPATRAMATIGAVPSPRRSDLRAGATGGRLDQLGASPQLVVGCGSGLAGAGPYCWTSTGSVGSLSVDRFGSWVMVE